MNSQPRHEVFGDDALGDRGFGCRRWGRPVVWRCFEGRGARLAWLVLAGAVLLIGCGRGGDSPSTTTTAGQSPASLSQAAEIAGPQGTAARAVPPPIVSVTEPDESSAALPAPVTPVAFAETSEDSAGSVKSATFDDIKFEMKKEDKFKQRMLTDKVNGLFDKTIRIRGYILPSFKQSGLTQFVLVRDNQECCFGKGAALYDCIVVQMVEGHTAEFSVRPVTVEGKFTFQKLEDPTDGALRAIYHLDGVSVK